MYLGVPHGNLSRNNALTLKEIIAGRTGKPSRFGEGTEKWGMGRERENWGGLRDQALSHSPFN